MKVVLTAEYPPVVRDILRDFEIEERPGRPGRSSTELAGLLRDADGAITTVNEHVTDEVLAACPKLKVVANYAVGTNNIDIAAARARKIVVTNTPGVLTEATADLTMALIYALVRRIPEGDRLVREGRFEGWQPLFFLGHSLQGKRLGILGMGRIGHAVAVRAQACGMSVVYHSRTSHLEVEREIGTPRLSFDDLIATSDIITIHTPLTGDTRHLINAGALAKMKKGALLINTSRGAVIDEKALADSLESGHLGGAALDVFEHEPAVEPRLLKLPNTVLAPHIGSATVEARWQMARIAASEVLRVLTGKKPHHPVMAAHATETES